MANSSFTLFLALNVNAQQPHGRIYQIDIYALSGSPEFPQRNVLRTSDAVEELFLFREQTGAYQPLLHVWDLPAPK